MYFKSLFFRMEKCDTSRSFATAWCRRPSLPGSSHDEQVSLGEMIKEIFNLNSFMTRSVTGSGPLASQPGALENVRYMTGREMPSMPQQKSSANQPPPPGTDVGNKNKFDSMSEAVKTSAAIPQGFKDLIGKRWVRWPS